MKRSSPPSLAAALLLAGGCHARNATPSPRPEQVTPPTGYAVLATDIAIHGEGFLPDAYQDPSGRPRLDARFRAWLSDTELDAVTWVSERELRARVPSGLAPGKHALTVEDPRGGRGALADAYESLAGPPETAPVASDPFADGTAFSFVLGYRGHVYLGPSGDGRGVVRCTPDGEACASERLRFEKDVVATAADGTLTTVHPNTCPTYETLGGSALGPDGAPLCDADNAASTACFCGPDYETRRGLWSAVLVGGEEWLVAVGSNKKGDVHYVYATSGDASPLPFSYADLSASLPSGIGLEQPISMAVLDDRLVLGMHQDWTPRPRAVVLKRMPAAPGLDATASDTKDLEVHLTAMGETGGTPEADRISQVDALAAFGGRLYAANRKACIVSKGPAPEGAADFEPCTPSSCPCTPTADWLATSIPSYPVKKEQVPADRGVAALVPWNGRLYLARNTAALVPELWACTPRLDVTGAPLPCDRLQGDWARIATNLGDPGNEHVSALFASERYLYLGFDSATGAKLYRTAVPPASEGSFTGRLGCAAPCKPFGGAGLGDPANTRFLDARAMRFGLAEHVWATVGGTGAARVYRILE